MPTIWLIVLYFLIKSNYWKKFFLYLGFIFLLITSLPITSTFVNKFFYSDSYRISNHHKKPAYVLIPGAGIWYDGYGRWNPTHESIIRTKHGKDLAQEYSIPMVYSGSNREAQVIKEYFSYYDFYLVEVHSFNTFKMAKNLKKFINVSDGPLLLATNPMHYRRTILALKKQNFDVLIPDNYIKNRKISYSIIPSARAIISFNEIIYESLGIVWYYFSGKI